MEYNPRMTSNMPHSFLFDTCGMKHTTEGIKIVQIRHAGQIIGNLWSNQWESQGGNIGCHHLEEIRDETNTWWFIPLSK